MLDRNNIVCATTLRHLQQSEQSRFRNRREAEKQNAARESREKAEVYIEKCRRRRADRLGYIFMGGALVLLAILEAVQQ